MWHGSLDFPDPLRASQAQRSLNPSAAALLNISIRTIRQTDNLMESFPKPSAVNQQQVWDQAGLFVLQQRRSFKQQQRSLDSHGPITIAIKVQLMCARSCWAWLAANGKQKESRPPLAKTSHKWRKTFRARVLFLIICFFFASLSNEETLSRCDRNAASAALRLQKPSSYKPFLTAQR